MPGSRSATWALGVGAVLVALKLWLVAVQDVSAVGWAMHDDRLFLEQSRHLLMGEWLGPYDALTLIKGPFYPLWIAWNRALGVPLLFAQHVLLAAACALMVQALLPLWKRPALPSIVLFAVLLFNPMSWGGQFARVIREGVYPQLGMIVIACAIGLMTRALGSPWRLAGWAGGLGLGLAALWTTREEGVWILPAVTLAVAVAVLRVLLANRREAAARPARPEGAESLESATREGVARRAAVRLAVLALPFILWQAALLGVRWENLCRYGVFTVVEVKSPEFLAAYGALARVGAAQYRELVPVPTPARQAIYPVSPAFRELEADLEGRLLPAFAGSSCTMTPVCDDMAGGWFVWAFREAVQTSGHYSSATDAAAYYRQLADEVNDACERGRLQCAPKRATLAPPLRRSILQPFLVAFWQTFVKVARFDDHAPEPGPSTGSPEFLELAADITGEWLMPTSPPALELRGWVVVPGKSPQFQVRHARGDPVDSSIRLRQSFWLREDLARQGRNLPEAANARFVLRTECWRGCSLEVGAEGRVLELVPIDGREHRIDRDDLYLHLEATSESWGAPAARLDWLKMQALAAVVAAYRAAAPWLAALAMIAYLALGAHAVVTREPWLWLAATSLLAAVLVRIALLSLIHVTSFPATHALYLSPAHPLMLAFICLTLLGLGSVFAPWALNHAKRLRGRRPSVTAQ